MDRSASIKSGVLTLGGGKVLADLPKGVTLLADPLETGVFLRVRAEKPAAYHRFDLGVLAGVRRFTCCYRCDPWWVAPRAGTAAREVPAETQYLLAELADGRYAVFLPLLDGPFYAALEGTADNRLVLTAETNDPATVGDAVTGLFIAVGDDPYRLLEAAAASITAFMGTGRLRRDKPLPDFVDLFGWCTWDAFYGAVSHEKVREGLQSFADGGVTPRFLILDDGWLSARTAATGENRLTTFAANEKFPGDLGPTVAMAKGEYGIDLFLVWHTLQGYWGGIDGEAMPRYRVLNLARRYSPGICSHMPEINTLYFGHASGLVAPEDAYRFFQDFHRHLRDQGVDGVKVDNQGSLDGLTCGTGGLATLMQTYHEALEGAAQVHFTGRVINCMSVSTNVVYHTLNSTVTRSSTDFWPNDPASHGKHLYINAQSSLWLGQFVHPDWDMFQSGHPMGAFHAAGRAISGGPVYVSDKPDGHDFAVLRKLALSDGTILRAREIGRPTRDCLFCDPVNEDVLLKIFNLNERAGVVGVFNARHHAEESERVMLAGSVRPADVEGLDGEEFAVYAHNARTLTRCARQEGVPVELAEMQFEIFTIVPVEDGVAPIGLVEKYNSAGAVTAKGPDPRGGYAVTLRDGGTFLTWCAQAPSAVYVDDRPSDFTYEPESGVLQGEVAEGEHTVRIE